MGSSVCVDSGSGLVRHLERVAEEVHQRRCAPTDPRVLIDESWCDDLPLAQSGRREEVLTPEVVCERMLGVSPRRHALERRPAEVESLREGPAARGAPPALRL